MKTVKYIPTKILAKMPFNRLKGIRRDIIAHINDQENPGWWCCELKCMWIDDPNRVYTDKQRNEDYMYRDLVNLYYDKAKPETLV